jgi:heme exporter protein C
VKLPWYDRLGLLAVALLLAGTAWGFWAAPPEAYMRATQKIMYIHVPSAWTTLLTFSATFVASVQWLRTRAPKWDHLIEASIEVGVVLGCVLSVTGAIWARPTFGVWWDWDPRLTSVAVMVLSYAGIAALRSFVDDPHKRATWAAVASITAYANVIFVYLCVKFLRSLHQVQSSPSTVDASMVVALRTNAFGMIFLGIWMVAVRWRIARARWQKQVEE